MSYLLKLFLKARIILYSLWLSLALSRKMWKSSKIKIRPVSNPFGELETGLDSKQGRD